MADNLTEGTTVIPTMDDLNDDRVLLKEEYAIDIDDYKIPLIDANPSNKTLLDKYDVYHNDYEKNFSKVAMKVIHNAMTNFLFDDDKESISVVVVDYLDNQKLWRLKEGVPEGKYAGCPACPGVDVIIEAPYDGKTCYVTLKDFLLKSLTKSFEDKGYELTYVPVDDKDGGEAKFKYPIVNDADVLQSIREIKMILLTIMIKKKKKKK